MKLSDYAKEKGITYRTAYNHFKQGLIPEASQLENGTIYISNNFKEDEDIWINISDILKSKGYIIRKDDEQ
jgi:predicted site-specific integrase-resolvase